MEEPSDDTPSVTPLRACQLPQGGSREWAAPFNRVLAKPWGYGRFSSPLRNSECWGPKKSKIFLDKWDISGYNKEADFGGAEII